MTDVFFFFVSVSIILIFQGTVMIGMGAVGIYKIKKNEGISLKKVRLSLKRILPINCVYSQVFFSCFC